MLGGKLKIWFGTCAGGLLCVHFAILSQNESFRFVSFVFRLRSVMAAMASMSATRVALCVRGTTTGVCRPSISSQCRAVNRALAPHSLVLRASNSSGVEPDLQEDEYDIHATAGEELVSCLFEDFFSGSICALPPRGLTIQNRKCLEGVPCFHERKRERPDNSDRSLEVCPAGGKGLKLSVWIPSYARVVEGLVACYFKVQYFASSALNVGLSISHRSHRKMDGLTEDFDE